VAINPDRGVLAQRRSHVHGILPAVRKEVFVPDGNHQRRVHPDLLLLPVPVHGFRAESNHVVKLGMVAGHRVLGLHRIQHVGAALLHAQKRVQRIAKEMHHQQRDESIENSVQRV